MVVRQRCSVIIDRKSRIFFDVLDVFCAALRFHSSYLWLSIRDITYLLCSARNPIEYITPPGSESGEQMRLSKTSRTCDRYWW